MRFLISSYHPFPSKFMKKVPSPFPPLSPPKGSIMPWFFSGCCRFPWIANDGNLLSEMALPFFLRRKNHSSPFFFLRVPPFDSLDKTPLFPLLSFLRYYIWNCIRDFASFIWMSPGNLRILGHTVGKLFLLDTLGKPFSFFHYRWMYPGILRAQNF